MDAGWIVWRSAPQHECGSAPIPILGSEDQDHAD